MRHQKAPTNVFFKIKWQNLPESCKSETVKVSKYQKLNIVEKIWATEFKIRLIKTLRNTHLSNWRLKMLRARPLKILLDKKRDFKLWGTNNFTIKSAVS